MSTEEQEGRRRESASGRSPGGRRWRRALPWVAVLVWTVAAGWGIGSYPLAEPDEGRNGTAACEMATGGHWWLPTYDGLPLLDKPLVWFDTAALALRTGLDRELAIRLPSLVFTACTVLLVAGFARRLHGAAAGWVAGAALATSPLVLAFARIAIFDAVLSFFMVAALVLFYAAVELEAPEGARTGRWSAALAWLAMALGVLTKGPVALAVPLLVAVPYALWRRRGRSLWSWPGVAGFAALVTGWAALVEAQVPGYLRYVVLTETVGRLASGARVTELGSSGGVHSLVPVLVAGSLPWSAVAGWSWLAAGWRRWRRGPGEGTPGGGPDTSTVYLVLWLVVPSLLFSFAEPKRLQYMLPVVPAIALLLAAIAVRGRVTPGALRAGAICLALPGLALLAAGSGAWPVLGRVEEVLRPLAHSGALAFGLVLVAASATAAWMARRRPRLAGAALALPGLLLPVVLFPLVAAVGRTRSTVDLAAVISERCAGVPVVGIDDFPSTLVFYLGRPVGLVSTSGSVFQSNYVATHWETIVAESSGDPLFATAWWEALPERAVVVFKRRHAVKSMGAEIHGFTPLASNRLYAVWSRGCGQPGPS